jgi:anti-sigma regulatory factor (Ser/Thr protein kinase)
MAEPTSLTLKIANETRYLASVRDAVRDVVARAGFPQELLNKLTLAVDESVTNVMEHAYEDDLEGELFIEIVLEVSADRFSATIRDWGKVFDPTKVPAPDLKAHVNEGRRHGLGIFLMKQIMDEVTYTSFPDGRNDLCMVRHSIGGSASGDGKAADPEAAQARANEA